jgi:Glycine cleavage system P-protein
MTDTFWQVARLKLDDFAGRHIGPSDDDAWRMLDTIGVPDLDTLIDQTVPEVIRDRHALGFGPGLSEIEVLSRIRNVRRGERGLNSPAVSEREIVHGLSHYGERLSSMEVKDLMIQPIIRAHGEGEVSLGDHHSIITLRC